MKRRKVPSWVSPAVSLLVLAALTAVFLVSFRGGDEPTQEGVDKLQAAVTGAAVQCYALEGAYPESIEYLEQHYGLSVDHTRFFVHYEVYASNMRPRIVVYPINAALRETLDKGVGIS